MNAETNDPKPSKHPADVRWQLACVEYWKAVQPPSCSSLKDRECLLIWVDDADWRRFRRWQREENVRG